MYKMFEAIIKNYISSEPKITQDYIYKLENSFIERYKIHNHNQFSCPEFENLFACLFELLNSYKEELSKDVPVDNSLLWQIKQSIESIKSCTQETKCTNTYINDVQTM